MVQLLVRLVAPPGHADEVIQACRTVLRAAQADRRCACAQLCREDDDAHRICYTEEWADADLRQQLDSDRFGRLLAVLETSAAPPVFEFRFVTETRGLDYVAAMRLRRDPQVASTAPISRA